MKYLVFALFALFASALIAQNARAATAYSLSVVNQSQSTQHFYVYQPNLSVQNRTDRTVVLSLFEDGREMNRLTLPAGGSAYLQVRGTTEAVQAFIGGTVTQKIQLGPCAGSIVIYGR